MKSAEHIRAALLKAVEAFNCGDAEAVVASPLVDWLPLGAQQQGADLSQVQSAFAAGCRFDLKWEELYVRLYGERDQIAIASGELSGSIFLPGKPLLRGPWR